jgi:hypothetical protein
MEREEMQQVSKIEGEQAPNLRGVLQIFWKDFDLVGAMITISLR